ncbi:hypothetical protein BTUL_0140g00060 [Botrytis tulipae]|uniref:Ketosynthase family 3 (KS3) domain-containing protein n=1 Tax=Botrytis tulipae TaxID=87230 RepID=A0A4Z1EG67_9HELO|nr:hypothetical protein BTUL_0140g00060 [Botrytis tulipae]
MEAQLNLIKECYNRASLDITETGYVEANITGTPTGDPIAAEALARTFSKSRKADDPVIVGSVKINFGHTAPVIAAIIKTAFILRHGLIPPNLNYKNTNPKIPLKDWKLQLSALNTILAAVPRVLTPWPEDKPMRASIKNFGYGGSNTHLVMERAPSSRLQDVNRNGISRNPVASRIYIVSSKDSMVNQDASKRLAACIYDSISNSKELSPADLAYNLAKRKSRFSRAVEIKVKSLEALAESLEDPKLKISRALRSTRTGFVFNGQGAQRYAMGRGLVTSYPIFGSAITNVIEILKS